MSALLYKLIEIITFIHEKILSWNDNYEYNFTDKELHFLVTGVFGMGLLLLIHPLFKFLTKKKLTLVISWIYVVTLLVVITFSIEIGQRITHTGYMDFRDIVYGMGGYFLMFFVFFVIRFMIRLIKKFIRGDEADSNP